METFWTPWSHGGLRAAVCMRLMEEEDGGYLETQLPLVLQLLINVKVQVQTEPPDPWILLQRTAVAAVVRAASKAGPDKPQRVERSSYSSVGSCWPALEQNGSA